MGYSFLRHSATPGGATICQVSSSFQMLMVIRLPYLSSNLPGSRFGRGV